MFLLFDVFMVLLNVVHNRNTVSTYKSCVHTEHLKNCHKSDCLLVESCLILCKRASRVFQLCFIRPVTGKLTA